MPKPPSALRPHPADRRREFRSIVAASACVAVVFVLVVSLKIAYDAPAASQLLKEEFALQYRFARQVAQGRGIPDRDFRLQHPEGIEPHKDVPLAMEYLVGAAARLLTGTPQDAALARVVVPIRAAWSSLSVLACAAGAWLVFREARPAIVAAVGYGFSQSSCYRSVPSFAHEDFALPLLFGGVVALLAGLSRQTPRGRLAWAVLAGLCWGTALLTWHFSRFFLAAQFSLLLAVAPWADACGRRRLRQSAAVVLGVLSLFGVASEHLRATLFLVSAPMGILAAALIATTLIGDERPGGSGAVIVPRLRAVLIVLAAAVLATSAVVLTGDSSATYGHVWEFLAARLRHLSGKPDDPQALSFAARILWTGSFHPPGLWELAYGMWAPLAGAVIAMARWLRSGAGIRGLENSGGLLLLLLQSASFLGLATLVSRLELFAVFFLSVLAGGAVWSRIGRMRRGTDAAIAAVTVVLVCNYPGVQSGAWLRIPSPDRPQSIDQRFRPVSQVDHSLLKWIELETPPDSAFVGRFNILPPILCYAGRPIVLHSKFEVPGIRAQVEEHFRCLFGTEDELAEFCDRRRAVYYLHDPMTVLATGVDSPRYLAGLRHVPRASVAYALQFAPERLRRFELVYQNGLYRVYRRSDVETPVDAAQFAYQPIFDGALFESDRMSEQFSDEQTGAVLDRLELANEFLRTAVPLFAAGRWSEAYPYYRRALEINPSLPYAHSHLGWMLLHSDQPDVARREADEAVRVDPYEPEAWFHRGKVLGALGDHAAAAASLERCRRLDPSFPGLGSAAAVPP